MTSNLRPHRYIIAVGSNQPRSRTLTPAALVRRAIAELALPPFRLIASSPILTTPPLGPSRRRYANAALLIETQDHAPPSLLLLLKAMERRAGRRATMRWATRPLDLDIILWSGGCWHDRTLTIPHRAFRTRPFVLDPVRTIAAEWRDPLTGLSIRHLTYRAKAAKPVDPDGRRL